MGLFATNVAFVTVFGFFVVVVVVLIVLVVRFTWQRAAVQRKRWLAQQAAAASDARLTVDGADRQRTALVLSGGGTRGAVQVGMLQVLAEVGFVPDAIYGVSVGAINGAAFAGDPTVRGAETLATIWRGIRTDHVYPRRRVHGPWQFLQHREAIHSNTGLHRIIEEGISFDRLQDSPVPIEVVATSLADGHERWFTSGPAVQAVLASAALPAIFPAVAVDGDRYIDGGVVDNVPIARAIEGGASRIVVLLCGPPTYVPPAAKRPVEAMLNAMAISVHARFSREMAMLPDGVEAIVCSAGDGIAGSYTDFSHTEELIELGRAQAIEVVRRYGLDQLVAEVEPFADDGRPAAQGSEPGSLA